jgi:hypothetical protein
MGTILAALGYGFNGDVEMEWSALFPVTRSMAVMLAGLGYEPRRGRAGDNGAVRTAASNPPLTRSMATILNGLGYGRHPRATVGSVARRHARVR